MAEAYIGLGANVGDRLANLAAARAALVESGAKVLALSSIYDTPPWGPVKQDNYLNQVIRIETADEPLPLLEKLRAIEISLGRDRNNEIRYGPRAIDLDILLYGDRSLDVPELTIPHPRLLERAFVLVPLFEIAPDLKVGNTPIRRALEKLDASSVRPYPFH